MQVVHEVCCGLDVHKKSVTACVLWVTGRRRQTREFGTFTRELLESGDWLRSCGVTHVAMESTGVYWKTQVPHLVSLTRNRAVQPTS
jgi:transposase